MKVSIWDFVNSDIKICVDLKKELKDEIATKILKDVSNVAKKLKINPARLYEYFVWQKSVIPLKIIYSIAELTGLSLNKLEKDIILIKQQHVPRKNSVKNPKLPLEINPYFTSIVANLFFDGSVPKDGKGTYYSQKDKNLMDDFLKRVDFVFGEVAHSVRKDHRGVLECRLPRLIGEICRHVYKIDSFGTFDAKMPKMIFDLDEDHKKAFIISGIIDEGSISYDGSIIFGISNETMIKDFDNLCTNIGLETKGVKRKKNSDAYYMYISFNRFKEILDDFEKRYPLISLRHKKKVLDKVLEIKKQEFFYTKSFSDGRKNRLLKEISNDKKTINKLSESLLIPPRTLRRYMYKLMSEGKISRTKAGTGYFYYSNS